LLHLSALGEEERVGIARRCGTPRQHRCGASTAFRDRRPDRWAVDQPAVLTSASESERFSAVSGRFSITARLLARLYPASRAL
jgi:hypothetical protein